MSIELRAALFTLRPIKGSCVGQLLTLFLYGKPLILYCAESVECNIFWWLWIGMILSSVAHISLFFWLCCLYSRAGILLSLTVILWSLATPIITVIESFSTLFWRHAARWHKNQGAFRNIFSIFQISKRGRRWLVRTESNEQQNNDLLLCPSAQFQQFFCTYQLLFLILSLRKETSN